MTTEPRGSLSLPVLRSLKARTVQDIERLRPTWMANHKVLAELDAAIAEAERPLAESVAECTSTPD